MICVICLKTASSTPTAVNFVAAPIWLPSNRRYSTCWSISSATGSAWSARTISSRPYGTGARSLIGGWHADQRRPIRGRRQRREAAADQNPSSQGHSVCRRREGGKLQGQYPTGTAEPSRPDLSPPDKPSIAVLPFTNMSGDPEQEYFADGISEDLITGLSHIRWLFVIARNSSSSTSTERSM